ncbi:MAG: glycosyltransferase family 4 protein [Bryobacteraceae bacterium]
MTGDTVGGVWNFTMELAEALGDQKVEVILAALGGEPSKAQRLEAAEIPTLTLLASDWKLEWMDSPWQDVEESGKWLLDLEKEYAPDVVHLNSFGHGALPWRTPVVLTAHSCMASWWSAVKHAPLPPAWNRYCRVVEAALTSVNAITAPSHAMLCTLGENYGIDVESESFRVIPNGRRASRFHVDIKDPFLLTAGRLWDEAKNIAAVANAAPQLPWPVYLAGSASGPVDGCRMLGQLSSDTLAGWYARAAIYVLPARYEPFGLSVLEAALSGCALVLGDIPSLRELWDGAAILVPPEDTEALAAACQDLIANPPLREELARESLERARAFTPERMASAYLATYEVAMKESYACAS